MNISQKIKMLNSFLKTSPSEKDTEAALTALGTAPRRVEQLARLNTLIKSLDSLPSYRPRKTADAPNSRVTARGCGLRPMRVADKSEEMIPEPIQARNAADAATEANKDWADSLDAARTRLQGAQ